MATDFNKEKILILDFGSQYTQLIARTIRESKVYSEIAFPNLSAQEIINKNPIGLILSGGPDSVYNPEAPQCDPKIFELNLPILGICYGMQLIAHLLKGKVVRGKKSEFGQAQLQITGHSPLFKKLRSPQTVLMSHTDKVEQLPLGFTKTASTDNCSIAAMENVEKNIFGLQFHPEVAHTPQGIKILGNFLFKICQCKKNWTMASFVQFQVEKIKNEIGQRKVICAISGGVDSTVSAVLMHKAIGKNLSCVFVDNGLLRKNEPEKIVKTFKNNLNISPIAIDARKEFLGKLAKITDPEKKRKIIGREFIRVFEKKAKELGKIDFLVQGTLYPDIIESMPFKGPSATIKSHHNVGGLPKKMKLKLIEPLRELFKDEVRLLGKELGIPDENLWRQPFPGPGLAVRILGKINNERLDILKEADDILMEEIKKAGLYTKIWQSFAVLLPVKTVGVMGDSRTYENVIAIRAVESRDGMTAEWVHLPYELLGTISKRIINEVKGVNRVVYDISSKPPSTIEWE